MDGSVFNGIRKRIQMLAREADDLESFTDQALQLVGELVSPRSLTLSIHDFRRDHRVIRATLSRKRNGWQLTIDDTDLYYRPSHLQRRYPRYLLHSYFCFPLDLPSRWSGTFLVEYPGIRILSPAQYQILRDILTELSDSLHIVLINQELMELEIQVQEKERINHELRQTMTDLSKEIYCVNSVFTVLTQSLDIVKIFTRILGTTLPMVKAKVGTIYFPETDQCISFQSSGLKYQYAEHDHRIARQHSREPCLKDYFESKFSQLETYPDGISFRRLPISHPSFSVSLRKCFNSLGIQSVFEFSICSGNEFFGLGLIGFSENHVKADRSRLFMITLNMTSLFLENISLMRDLERQVKLKSQEILGMEKEQRFLFDHMDGPFSLSKAGMPVISERILEEIDRSRRAVFLGELASGVAHQIRNPLNELVGVLHLIKNKDTTGEEETGQMLDQVTERVETIHRMINKFIHYTRIPELNLTLESINDVLKNTLQTFKGWIDLAEVEVITSFDPKLSLTKLDLYLMNQVYHNIIKNAIEAMYSHGQLRITTRKLKIKHGPKPRLEFVEILFQDSGPGIPQENIDKVLNPFFSRKKDGIGLGLAIVDHVVRLHGGGVRIENRLGKGTNVTLYLPIR